MIPIIDGRPDPTRTEFTTFSLDDLDDESDRDLVAEGAIFYWTIGRGRTAAGTQTMCPWSGSDACRPPGRR